MSSYTAILPDKRGSAESRRRRREWLVITYRADVDAVRITNPENELLFCAWSASYETESRPGYTFERVPACRCYRCGKLLTVETLTVDRIIPGCQGGTYRRNNIRPACGSCNSSEGTKLRGTRK